MSFIGLFTCHGVMLAPAPSFDLIPNSSCDRAAIPWQWRRCSHPVLSDPRAKRALPVQFYDNLWVGWVVRECARLSVLGSVLGGHWRQSYPAHGRSMMSNHGAADLEFPDWNEGIRSDWDADTAETAEEVCSAGTEGTGILDSRGVEVWLLCSPAGPSHRHWHEVVPFTVDCECPWPSLHVVRHGPAFLRRPCCLRFAFAALNRRAQAEVTASGTAGWWRRPRPRTRYDGPCLRSG